MKKWSSKQSAEINSAFAADRKPKEDKHDNNNIRFKSDFCCIWENYLI